MVGIAAVLWRAEGHGDRVFSASTLKSVEDLKLTIDVIFVHNVMAVFLLAS